MASFKTVWQTDGDGFLLGTTVADESPLEPGVFLIPAGAVEEAPPGVAPPKQAWRWVGGVWVLAKKPKVKIRVIDRIATKIRAFRNA